MLNLLPKGTTSGGGGSSLYRGRIALASDGVENLPNKNTGTENVGQELAVGSEWVASQDGILSDGTTQVNVAEGDVLMLLAVPPTTVADVNIISQTGPTGPIGSQGPTGNSAYAVAVANGFVGDETAWLASLVGPTGATGATGPAGANGADGAPGAAGADGDSAYAVAVANGFVGDETAWLASLVGADGADGAAGAAGADGADGIDGTSAYDVAVANGFVGTVNQWLDSLQGDAGPTGPAGPAASVTFGDYTSETAELTDQILFGDTSDSGNTKKATIDELRTLLGISTQGLWRGAYTPNAVGDADNLPGKDDGTVNVGKLQNVGDMYVIASDGQISDGTNGEVLVYAGDVLVIESAPATFNSHVRVIRLSVVWSKLYAAAARRPLQLGDEILVNDDSATDQTNAARATLADLVSFLNSIDRTFSSTEISQLQQSLSVRRATKVNRMIVTAAISAGTSVPIDGSHASTTLLAGSSGAMELPATKAEYESNHDIQVYWNGRLANKVLSINTYSISPNDSLTFMTASYTSTSAIVFQEDLAINDVIEIHYHNAPALSANQGSGEPPADPPPQTVTVDMCDCVKVDLSGFVDGEATYSVLSVSGDGKAEIRDGSTLVYQSSIEAGPVTVQYRATQNTGTTDGTLEVVLANQFTEQDAKDFVQFDIDNLVDLADSFAGNQSAVYETSYLCLGLRNMFQGTGDRAYFDSFKTHVDKAIAAATNNYTAAATGNPIVSGTPHEDYGGDTTANAYSAWQDPSTLLPNVKATDQWAMTALLFLYDVITQAGEASNLLAADRTWAESTAYPFIAKNVIEFNRTRYGDDGVFLPISVNSARTKVKEAGNRRWGYWNSNVGVASIALTIDQAIRDHLVLGDHSYVAVQSAYATTNNWQTTYGWNEHYPRQDTWWDWFKERVVFDTAGRATWDVGNENINSLAGSVPTGWGVAGEEKAPDIGHGFGRYGYWAWLKVYLGQDVTEARQILEGFDRQWSEICVLPSNYVTPDGDHAGEIAEGIQVSNYINGVDTSFRLGKNAANSTAGMGSHSYYSQFGFTRPESREALLRLYRNAIVYHGPTSKEHTGTYSRHLARSNFNTPATSNRYSGFSLIGNFLTAMKQSL